MHKYKNLFIAKRADADDDEASTFDFETDFWSGKAFTVDIENIFC